MRALLLSEYKTLSVVDMPTPEIGDDDVLVRVRACGICGSDIHGYDGSTGRRIPPLVMGHEAAGVIEQVGRGVQGFEPGERVSFDSTVSCGTCHFCRRGQINLCDNRTVLGVSCGDYRRHGAFAEYVAVPSRILYKLPDSLPFERAALIEVGVIAVHAVSRHVPKPDDTVVVVGAG
jgi:L-iditol 2-dehydrogenase